MAAWQGPWFAATSPWNTPIPSDCPVHPDTPSMVQGVYIGTDSSPMDVHAFAYRPSEMVTKDGPSGTTFCKWAGPGMQENIIFSPAGTPTVTVYSTWDPATHSYIYRNQAHQVPMPQNWTGYNSPGIDAPTYYERRTTVVCENGDLYLLYQVTPPGHPILDVAGNQADPSFWAATSVDYIPGGWTGDGPTWVRGGSGLPPFPGIITPYDILNTPVGGHFNHALAFNCSWSADGSYSGANGPHAKSIWPAPTSIHPNTDGRTKTAVGIPHGARIFLDPTMTDADLVAAGVTQEWMKQIARTAQVYGGMSKESVTGQGGSGGIITESNESIAWNVAHGFYPAGFQWPWVADGTTDGGDKDSTVYNAAFPQALIPPDTGSRWKVADWRQSIPGITAPATGGSGGGGSSAVPAYVQEVLHSNTLANPGATVTVNVTNAPAAGNKLILSVAVNQAALTLTSVTDAKGNAWTVDEQDSDANTSLMVAVAGTVQNVAKLVAGDAIILHFSVAVTARVSATVDEWSGLGSVIDQVAAEATAGSTGTARDAGTTPTTTNPTDVVWAAYAVVGAESSFTPGAGYSTPTTPFYVNSTLTLERQYQVVSADGAFHPTATGGVAARSIGVTVAYEAAAAPSPPSNTVPPAVTGSGVVGQVLTTNNGTWTDDGSPTFTYRWERDNLGDTNFSPISGATSSTYTLINVDAGCDVHCVVIDTDSHGSSEQPSNQVAIVEPAPPSTSRPHTRLHIGVEVRL